MGEKDGSKASYTFTKSGYDRMDYSTSIPAGIVAAQLLKGEINIRGVIPPECLEPKKIIASLHGVGYFEGEKDFQVERVIDERIDSGSILDASIFPELW